MHSHTSLSAIVAMSQNRVIGKNNQLPWHMPADLKHFKNLTTGNTILMGRKTYESIGKPLPNRTNIILTHDNDYKAPGCFIAHDMNEALQYAAKAPNEFFVIGGATLYQAFLPHISRIFLTIIHHDFQGDAYFPELDKADWVESECITHLADEMNPYNYSFIQMVRK